MLTPCSMYPVGSSKLPGSLEPLTQFPAHWRQPNIRHNCGATVNCCTGCASQLICSDGCYTAIPIHRNPLGALLCRPDQGLLPVCGRSLGNRHLVSAPPLLVPEHPDPDTWPVLPVPGHCSCPAALHPAAWLGHAAWLQDPSGPLDAWSGDNITLDLLE